MSAPFISVVVPTYNRPARLRRCVEALAAFAYPRDRFEVVIVDDGSREPVDDVVDAFRTRLTVRLVRQRNAGPAAARNAGAAVARGDLLAFTDDDCRPATGWLDAFAEAHAAFPDSLLGGETRNALTDDPYARVSQYLVSFLYDYFNGQSDGPRFFTSNNFALPRTGFDEIGGFDTAFPLAAGEDREFCDRWHAAGRPLRHVPEALVLHEHAMTLGDFWRQHLNYGRGAFHYHRARQTRAEGGLAPEPLHFYTNLVRYPLTAPGGRGAYSDAFLMALTQVANVAGYAYERVRHLRTGASSPSPPPPTR